MQTLTDSKYAAKPEATNVDKPLVQPFITNQRVLEGQGPITIYMRDPNLYAFLAGRGELSLNYQVPFYGIPKNISDEVVSLVRNHDLTLRMLGLEHRRFEREGKEFGVETTFIGHSGHEYHDAGELSYNDQPVRGRTLTFSVKGRTDLELSTIRALAEILKKVG